MLSAGVTARLMARFGPRRVMLPGQQLGRRQQGGLRAALDRRQHREQGDHGFAAADVALQKPHHTVRPADIRRDLGQREPLRSGQGEAEPRLDRRGEPARADR